MTEHDEAMPPAPEQTAAGEIQVTANGECRRLPAGAVLAAFLAESNVPARYVAVAVNGEVVRRDAHERVILQDGDVVEIVRMVGGGADRDSLT